MKQGDLVTLKTYTHPFSPFHGKIHMIKEIQGDTVVLLGVVGWVYLSEVELIHETR